MPLVPLTVPVVAADGRAVVVYDQLGCGRSDRPDGIAWSLQVFLDEHVVAPDEGAARRALGAHPAADVFSDWLAEQAR